MSRKIRRSGSPDRKRVLFNFLFGRKVNDAFDRISVGLSAIVEHAAGLVNDPELLAASKRYERADFLVATAREELGKLYVLLDMCRVDIQKHESILRHLCGAFYSHMLKYVYFNLSAHRYPGIVSLIELQHFFKIEATEWWTGSPENGEPDTPHDTFFARETNLYVDVDSYSDTWMLPKSSAKSIFFETPLLDDPLNEVREVIARIKQTESMQLFRPAVLHAFNGQMKKLLVNERTSMEALTERYNSAGKVVAREIGISTQDFETSELYNWPMYWIER
jgi:AbiV family abortive infection protein